MAITKLSFRDQQKLTKPVAFLVNYNNPNSKQFNGSTSFEIQHTVEENGDDELIHTLDFAILVDSNQTITNPQKTSIRSLDGKTTVEAIASKKITNLGYKLLGQYKIVVNTTDDTFVVEDVWETGSNSQIKVGKDHVIPRSVTFNLTQDYKDVIIQSYQDVFLAVVELNQQHQFLSNPTISLLLHLIAVGDSNYTPIFLEWFEEQFVNTKDEYRKLFGNTYLPTYNKLRSQEQNQIVISPQGDPLLTN